MVLFVDNFDSFTYNLVQYVGEINPDIKVFRNNELSVEEALSLNPSHIILSPGPCTPKEAGICVELVQKIPKDLPLLGVCLGHQSIGAAFGARIVKAKTLMHGKLSTIKCTQKGLFAGLPEEFEATRYHSLIIDEPSLGEEFIRTAFTQDGTLMGIEHRNKRIYGVQFHPESIKTQFGKQIIQNFLSIGQR